MKKLPFFLRFHGANLGLCGVILIPLLGLAKGNDPVMYGFWSMVWGGCWGMILGTLYTEMRHDIGGKWLGKGAKKK